MTSNKLVRILFTIIGVIMPIFIGLLHTYAHFTDLIKPEVQSHLQQEIMVTGQTQIMWNTWGVMSVMMGISFIVIGLLNISIIRNTNKNSQFPTLPIFAMIFYLSAVIYVGLTFNADMQLYGGIAGMMLTIVCLITNLKS